MSSSSAEKHSDPANDASAQHSCQPALNTSSVTREENANAMQALGKDTEDSWRTPQGDVVTVKAVKVLALWSLKVGTTESCAICRESLQSACVQCVATGHGSSGAHAFDEGGEECRVAQLPCGHLYHHHCVSGWLRSRDPPCCPTCQAVVYSSEDISFL